MQSSSNRLAATGLPRIEAVSFVSASRVPQMAGAEEVVGGDHPSRRSDDRGPRAERARATTDSSPRDSGSALLLRRERELQPTQSGSERRGVARGRGVHHRAGAGGRRLVDRDAEHRFRVPVRGAGRSRTGRRHRRAGCRLRGPTRSSSPTRSGSPFRARSERSSRTSRGSGFPSACTCTTRATRGMRTRSQPLSAGATLLDASLGGIGGCPFAPRATGNIATEDLVYLLARRGDRDGGRPRRADRGRGLARGDSRRGARGPGVSRWHRFRRLPVGTPVVRPSLRRWPRAPLVRSGSVHQVLVLNASYEPLNVCSDRRAHVLVWKGKAEVVEQHAQPLRLRRAARSSART